MAQSRGEERSTFRAKVTGRHAVTLPAELCHRLDIDVGDSVEFEVADGYATLRRVQLDPVTEARGILRGYFSSWEDVNRFVEEERRGWEEREQRLMEQDAT